MKKNLYLKRRIVNFIYPMDSSVFRSRDGQNRYSINNHLSNPVTYDNMCVAILDNKRPQVNDTVYVNLKNIAPYIDEIIEIHFDMVILKGGGIAPIRRCSKVLGTNKLENLNLPLIDYKTLYSYLVDKKNQNLTHVHVSFLFNALNFLPKWILKILDKFEIFNKYIEIQKFYSNIVFLDIIV